MDAFGALADETRRALLTRLKASPARVVDLAGEHDMTRPAISKHLRILREADLVTRDVLGRESIYRLNPAGAQVVRQFVASLWSAPPIPEAAFDALDLEVRRTVREQRALADRQPQDTDEPTPQIGGRCPRSTHDRAAPADSRLALTRNTWCLSAVSAPRSRTSGPP